MADSKITALTAISTVDPTADPLVIVDVSDTSMAASGTTKKSTINQLLGSGGTATLASATITGDLTVDTTTLVVNPAGYADRVGIGTATPAYALDINGVANFKDGTIHLAGGQPMFARIGAANSFLYAGTNALTIRNNADTFSLLEVNSAGVCTFLDGAGGTRMTLDATGLGIGASPSYQLHVAKSQASQTAIYVDNQQNNAAASSALTLSAYGGNWSLSVPHSATFVNPLIFKFESTPMMTLDASGNLLLGTTAPLQISNNPAVTSRIANLGTGSKGAMILRENEASAFWGGNVFLQKVRGTSTAVQSGDILGTVAFGGFDGTNYVNTAVIQTSVTGAVSAGVVPVKIQVVATSGGVELTNTATSWAAISDERLKDIIEPINNAVAKVGLLRSVIGKYKSDSEGTRRSFLIAQDVQSALPEAVGGNEDSMTIRYTEVIPLLVAAIKELTAEVNALKKA